MEFRGTYPLPEAQLDRFAVVTLGYVPPERKWRFSPRRDTTIPLMVQPVVTLADVLALKHAVEKIRISEELKRYVVDVVAATRTVSGIQLGASRASIA